MRDVPRCGQKLVPFVLLLSPLSAVCTLSPVVIAALTPRMKDCCVIRCSAICCWGAESCCWGCCCCCCWKAEKREAAACEGPLTAPASAVPVSKASISIRCCCKWLSGALELKLLELPAEACCCCCMAAIWEYFDSENWKCLRIQFLFDMVRFGFVAAIRPLTSRRILPWHKRGNVGSFSFISLPKEDTGF